MRYYNAGVELYRQVLVSSANVERQNVGNHSDAFDARFSISAAISDSNFLALLS